ncbi:MAG TPA: SDR family oxidoreductase [Candidatus Hydrogenedentes bacterium]|nr:SDR family oxidoreductase [Candidatus Hydrogenedentota bacterium]
MSDYLVTGGAGFIGSNIVRFLVEQDASVRVIDNFETGHRENLESILDRIELVEGDLRDPRDCARAVEGVRYVLHQAAVPSVPRSVADPLESHEANATATLNLLIAARDARVKRVVYAGSSSAYGDQPGDAKHETMRPDPLSPYGASKLASEYYLRVFSACYGLETITLRYFNVFGPRQDPNSPYSAVIPLFINAVLEGRRPTIFGDGGQSRDFTYVENNVRANILAATADLDADGQIYNIACGESYTLLDLLAGINEALGTRVEPEFAPPRVGDIRDSRADISRAKMDLGYRVFVPLAEGLRRTIEWYKALRDA